MAVAAEARRRDARVDRTHVVLRGALVALLDERPFDEITVREITARAGCGYATFFRHYPDRRALLAGVAEQAVADLFGRLLPVLSGSNDMQAARALCASIQERWTLWKALLTGGAAGEV
ncbi:MAG: TetR/AcrR family transcriptional regulator, partial [Sphingomonadales bacterium]